MYHSLGECMHSTYHSHQPPRQAKRTDSLMWYNNESCLLFSLNLFQNSQHIMMKIYISTIIARFFFGYWNLKHVKFLVLFAEPYIRNTKTSRPIQWQIPNHLKKVSNSMISYSRGSLWAIMFDAVDSLRIFQLSNARVAVAIAFCLMLIYFFQIGLKKRLSLKMDKMGL